MGEPGGKSYWRKALSWRGRRGERDRPCPEPAEWLGGGGELADAIAVHERLLGDLAEAAAAQQAVLQALYQVAGLKEGEGEESIAPLVPVGGGSGPIKVQADLEARLFGPFEAKCRGVTLAPWSSRRAASLLKFLLLHYGRPVRREVLMEAFWPGSSPKSARNNLNVTVYQLRQRLRAHYPDRTHIVYSTGSYHIDPELCCRVDVDDYNRSVARGHQAIGCGDRATAIRSFHEARKLYAGPLLEGDTSGDWYLETQRRFHIEHCAVLERLCVLLLEHGDVGGAVSVGSELLGTDPCRETAHQLLMRAYAALDQPHLIVQQFKRCEITLRRELSVELSETTVRLYRALLSGR
jgi:DNA-binding SARP family transcriptional activator